MIHVQKPHFEAVTNAVEKLVAIALELKVRIVHALTLDLELLNQMVLADVTHLLQRLGMEKIVHVHQVLKGRTIVLLAAKHVRRINTWMYMLIMLVVNQLQI